ncbi:endonuclease/exonuclease/phosphatase family protein [Vulgatibacter incomptus]|uniref:endonuclease/exonuclease/phosphatase family protein n=1 Tax=Vulgatibacter incomptus TaxID=1391653 RepID=UPI0014705EF0|nr:endonuclease/exonuclease/phosphatase family protein [Vulgatibacter incomptus]
MATYNILHASLKGLDAIASVLAGIDADLIGLQEVDQGVERSGGAWQAAELADRLGFHHTFAAACPWESGLYGVAVLSRFPILGRETTALPSRAILPLGDGAEPRILVEAEIELPAGLVDGATALTFAVTHLGLDPTERRLQADAIASRLHRRPRTLLCGDFNEGRTEPAYAKLSASLTDCVADAGGGLVRSYPSHRPTIGIDHVLRSGDLPPASRAWAVPTEASDHLPVVVDLG